jgi:hypothetical protein
MLTEPAWLSTLLDQMISIAVGTGFHVRVLERFPAKACPGRDPGWIPVRVKKTRQNNK